MWHDSRLIKLLGIEHPIILAPMAGATDAVLVAEVSEAGGLGSLPCAMLTPQQLRDQFAVIRASTAKPVNCARAALVAGPPSPEYPRTPLPATVVMIPLLETLRTRLLT